MKVAIIGGGIGGVMAASELHAQGHEITLYEASNDIGGHVRTVWLPIDEGTSELVPHELGVFMIDPKNIHPQIASLAKDLDIGIKPFPLTFTLEHPEKGLNWTTVSKTPPLLKGAEIFSSQLIKNLGKRHFGHNIRFFIDLFFLFRTMEKIHDNRDYCSISLGEFIEMHSISKSVVDLWLLPQLQCWWGINRKEAFLCSTQVLVDSICKVARDPQYIFVKSWSHFIEAIAKPFRSHVLTECPVEQVIREKNGVKIFSKGQYAIYDHVVIATPPNVTLKLLANPTSEERRILSSFTTCVTEVFLHTDASWMPQTQKKAVINLIKDKKGSFCTFWTGGLHPAKPDVYLTWGDQLMETPKKQILSEKWLRTLPTVDYAKACSTIHSIQGNGGIWHCGAHVHSLDTPFSKATPSVWHENAFLSGKLVAQKILKNMRSVNG